jgi:hypothetical protein
MDIKYFALQDWVESDLIIFKDISTSDNAADAFTKVLSTQLFHHHYDTYMGRTVSDYWQSTIRHLVPTPECDLDNKSPCCSKVHHRTWDTTETSDRVTLTPASTSLGVRESLFLCTTCTDEK